MCNSKLCPWDAPFFSDIRLQKMSWPWNPGQRSLKVIGTATCDFLLTLHSKGGPISYHFRDKCRVKNRKKISHPSVICASLKEVSATGVKKLEWWGYLAEKEVWRYLPPCGYNTRTWQTDTGLQQRSRLRIASRGKGGNRQQVGGGLCKVGPVLSSYDSLCNNRCLNQSVGLTP